MTDRDRSSLSVCLQSYYADEIRTMFKWFGIKNSKITRKDQMIDVIASELLGTRLRETWAQLNRLQQLAVREAVFDDFNEFGLQQFEAKYGKLPTGFSINNDKHRLPFRLFLHSERTYSDNDFMVPKDLANKLREFVESPRKAKLKFQSTIPDAVERQKNRYRSSKGKNDVFISVLVQRLMEMTAQRDLVSVLRLVDLGRVSVGAKTGRPSAATMKRIAEELSDGDFFELTDEQRPADQTVGSIRGFSWPLLIQEAKLAKQSGSKLVLSKNGHAALNRPAAEILKNIWTRWLDSESFDEFNRVSVIKGQTRQRGRRALNRPTQRRTNIEKALSECPVGQWVSINDFSKFMLAAGHKFSVAENAWRLYIIEPEYGSLGHGDLANWHLLQFRYILCFLFEYAATLGVIDVAYTHPINARPDYSPHGHADDLVFLSRYDGLEYFRLNALGAYCLGLTGEYEPTVPPIQTSMSIYSDMRIQSNGELSHDVKMRLETYAKAESDDVWRLSMEKAMTAIENGHSPADLRNFLTEIDDQPLPEVVEGFIRKVEKGASALTRQGFAILVNCSDEDTARILSSDSEASKFCKLLGKTQLAIRRDREEAFRKVARKLGFVLRKA